MARVRSEHGTRLMSRQTDAAPLYGMYIDKTKLNVASYQSGDMPPTKGLKVSKTAFAWGWSCCFPCIFGVNMSGEVLRMASPLPKDIVGIFIEACGRGDVASPCFLIFPSV
jgi:hypothetical protein